ncbi:MAG: hypothetical protein MJZ41_16130 [Bacteroidaceae bacterium]|nr:hypothetical protein [Bacteroidaceae bacterium]
MKKYLFVLALILSTAAYADELEVVGQFVVAPISTDECQASATTMPTAELSLDSELFSMLTFYVSDSEGATGIKDAQSAEMDDCKSIYSLDGQRLKKLRRGMNIVVDSQGKVKKVLIK